MIVRPALLLLFAAASLSAPAADRPNIIFVMVDDMGVADLGCYGQQAYATPHLDRMAAEGLRFTQAYSACVVCAPARSSLMTGLHQGHAPVRGNTGGIPLPSESITMAEVLRDAGYATGGFGKWGLGEIDTHGAAERQGFDRFLGYYHQIHAHYYYPEYLIDSGDKYPLPGNAGFYELHSGAGPRPARTGDLEHQFTHSVIARETFEWIRKHRERPFFCYAAWTIPHGRMEIPADDPAWQAVKDKPWNERTRVHAAFNLMLDRHMGELFELIAELGIDDNTVVLFASDHGPDERYEGTLDSAGELRGAKRSIFEGGLRVPLIARWPGKTPAGKVTDQLTYFPDLLPTFADLAAAEAPPCDGVSITPLLSGTVDEIERGPLYWEYTSYNWGQRKYDRTVQAVRDGKWKILREGMDRPWQLYNLEEDPGETRSVAIDHADIVRRLDGWVAANREDAPPQIEPEHPPDKAWR